MPNKELLLKTLNYIKTHPDEWDQTKWRCGTKFCFAGTAVKLDGGQFISSMYLEPVPADPPETILSGLGQVSIGSRAERILGLDAPTAIALFYHSNTLKDLEEQIAILIAEPLKVATPPPHHLSVKPTRTKVTA